MLISKEVINFKPMTINYSGVLRVEDTLFLYGNSKYYIKTNLDISVIQRYEIKLIENIVVEPIEFYVDSNKYVVFSKNGYVFSSNDFGLNWNIVNLSDSKILAVIKDKKIETEYYVRTKDEILKLDEKFEKLNQYQINSDYTIPSYGYYKFELKKSITKYRDKILLTLDSARVLVLDSAFNKNEIIDFNTYLDSNEQFWGGYDIVSTYNEMFFYLTTVSKNGYLRSRIIQFNLISTKLYKDSLGAGIVNVFNDSLFYFKKDDKSIRDTNALFSLFSHNSNFFKSLNDFYKVDDIIYFIGNNSLIQSFNLKSNNAKTISEFVVGPSQRFPPIIINDSTYNFLDYTLPLFYKTTNKGITYFPTKSKAEFLTDSLFTNQSKFNRYLYNHSDSLLYLIGKLDKYSSTTYLFVLDKDLNVIEHKQIEGYNPQFNSPINMPYNTLSALSTLEIGQNDNLLYFIGYNVQNYKTNMYYTSIMFYNKNWDYLKVFVDSNYTTNFVFAKDTNTFLVHSADILDSSKSVIKYTNNNGANWIILKKYDKQDSLLFLKQIDFGNQSYLFLFHSDGIYEIPNNVILDIVDLNTFSIIRQKVWYNTENDSDFIYRFYVFQSQDKSNLYLSTLDTLYFIRDIMSYSQWLYKFMPNKGVFVGPSTEDKGIFYSRFTYLNHPIENNFYIISFPDTTLMSVEGNELYKRNYFYSYDVYPNPAQEKVTANIYWDKTLDINNAEVGIYDIYGNKIQSQENIEIIQESDWTGKLTWNCSGVPSGTYFIRIQYGTEDRVIKLLKNE